MTVTASLGHAGEGPQSVWFVQRHRWPRPLDGQSRGQAVQMGVGGWGGR